MSLEINNPKEFIVCAAIHYDTGELYNIPDVNNVFKFYDPPVGISAGIVVQGRRHKDCYNLLFLLAGNDAYDNAIKMSRSIQGFITSHNRFVDRIEALVIAKIAGQIYHGVEINQLTSEDLY